MSQASIYRQLSLLPGRTKVEVDSNIVKSLNTLSTVSGVTFTEYDVNKHYLYIGNEDGYNHNGIYKVISVGTDPNITYELTPIELYDITQLKNLVGTLPSDVVSTNVVAYIQEYVNSQVWSVVDAQYNYSQSDFISGGY